MSVLTTIFLFSWFIQMVFLITFTIKYIYHEKRIKINNKIEGEEITIVVCARNEHNNLKHNFCHWINQKSHQSKCELIIVNDGSTDKSQQFLEKMLKKHSNLKLINIKPKEKMLGKKTALNKGVTAAKGEYIILTDADCKPSSNGWAAEMANCLVPVEKKIVLGLAPYNAQSSLVNTCVQYETTLTAILYSGFALCNLPYMGVGRNMGYKKSFYLACGGHANHPKELISGDDDIFINQYSTASNVAFCSKESAQCYSAAPQTFQEWLIQKKRHLSTSGFYKKKHQFLLSLYSISHFLYTGTLFVLTFTGGHSFLLLFILRVLIFTYLFKKIRTISNFYNCITVIINDIVHILYYLIITLFSIFVQKNNWK